MSYILDALRKADSERERGAIPSIHAQPVPLVSDDTLARRRPALRWAVGGLFALLLGALAWLLLERDDQRGPTRTTPPGPASVSPSQVGAAPATTAAAAPLQAQPASGSATVAPIASPPASPLASVPVVAAIGGLAAPVSQKPLAQAAAAAPAVTRRPPTVAAAPKPKPETPRPSAEKTTSSTSSAAPPSRRSPRKEDPPQTSAAVSGPVYMLKELPEGIRRELPTLPIGGSIYSKSATDRLLIIHGQLFHEGDTLAPGLTLEQIRLKSAVLSYKGYRYEISF